MDSALRVALVLLTAVAATAFLRRRSAALRHWVLSAAIVCAALTPLFVLVVPSWRPRLVVWSFSRPSSPGPIAVHTDFNPEPRPRGRQGIVQAAAANADHSGALRATLLPLWIAGTGICFVVLLLGFWRLAWIASRARPVLHGRWVDLAEEISRDYGLSQRVRLLHSDHPALLVTWGIHRPKVILPRDAVDWSDARTRIVLRHELAHIRRHDWAAQIAAELLRSVYWFNPLAWIACRRLRRESEQACDDLVLNAGVEGWEYATHLVELARAFRTHGRTWSPAPAMARGSGLERRIRVMLDTNRNRRPVARWAAAAIALGLLLVTLPISGLATAGPIAPLSGSVLDPAGEAAGEVVIMLMPARGRQRQVRSDNTGRFGFPGVPAGEYRLGAVAPGFHSPWEPVLVAGQPVQQNLKLGLAPVVMRTGITDRDRSSAVEIPGPEFSGPSSLVREFQRDRDNAVLQHRLVPPRLVTMRRPEFPTALRGTGFQGSVSVEGRIGADGLVTGVQSLTRAHADLEKAVVAALSGWRWEAARVNGAPVEVPISVTVDFVHER